MGKISWEQSSNGNQASTVVLSASEDFLSFELPQERSGWTRIFVQPVSKDQRITAVTLLDDGNQRLRFRKSTNNSFDQVLELNSGKKSLEISGVNLLSIRVELQRSSSLSLLRKVLLSILSDIFRLGVRRRNLRTFFQILRAKDFASLRKRLLNRYNQSPLSADLGDGVITPKIWMDRFVALSEDEHAFVDATIKENVLPTFSIVVDSSCGPVENATLVSLDKQKLAVQDSLVTSRFGEVLDSVSGEWLIFIKESTELEEVATFALGIEAQSDPTIKMILSDGSEKSDGEICGIRANPPWNLDLVLTGEELGPLIAVHRSAVSTISENIDSSGMPTFTEIGLLIFETFGEKVISQLSVVLCVDPQKESGGGVDYAVENYLARVRSDALVVEGLCQGTRRIKWPVPKEEPKVSILIQVVP